MVEIGICNYFGVSAHLFAKEIIEVAAKQTLIVIAKQLIGPDGNERICTTCQQNRTVVKIDMHSIQHTLGSALVILIVRSTLSRL